jgi:hypothetical protein
VNEWDSTVANDSLPSRSQINDKMINVRPNRTNFTGVCIGTVKIDNKSGSKRKKNLPGLERTSSFQCQSLLARQWRMLCRTLEAHGPLRDTKTGRGRTTTVDQTFSSGRGTIGSCANAVGYSGFVSWANMSIV